MNVPLVIRSSKHIIAEKKIVQKDLLEAAKKKPK